MDNQAEIDRLGGSAGNTADRLNDLERASRETADATATQKRRIDENNKAFQSLYENTKKLTGGFSKWSDQLTFGAGSIGKALEKVGDDMLKEGGNKYAAALAKMTGRTVGAAGEFAKAGLEQQDNLVKAYRNLSEFGAIDTGGIEGLQNTLADIGTTSENVGYFQEALAKVAPELAIFGGTVAGGAKATTGVVKGLLDVTGEFEGKLTQFGYTTEDIMKYSATFIGLNSRNMQGLNKDTNALQQATYNYMKDLTELAELTGNSRDQQVAAQKELQNEFGWRLKLRQMAEQGPEGKQQADRAEAFMRNLQAMNPVLAKTIRDIELHGGATTAETAQKAGQYRETIKEYRKQLAAGNSVQEGFAKIGDIASGEAAIAIRKFGYAATFGSEAQSALAMSTQDINMAERKNWKEASAAITSNTAHMEAEGDARLKAETERQQRERMLNNTYQDVFFVFGTKAVNAVNNFIQAMTSSARILVNTTEAITGKKMTDRFIGEEIIGSNKEITAIQKERLDLENELRTVEQNKSNSKKEDRWYVPDAWYDNQIESMKEELKQIDRRLAEEKKYKEEALEKARRDRAVSDASSFKMKSGLDWSKEQMNPTALDLMAKIQQLPKFKQFTSANEYEFDRQNPKGKFYNPDSLHPKGQAFDFTYGEKATSTELKQLKETIKEFEKTTNSRVRMQDTYTNPIKGEAPHIHIEVIPNGAKSTAEGKLGYNGKIESAPKYAMNDVPENNSNKNDPGRQMSTYPNGVDNSVLLSKLDELKTLFDRSVRVQEDILSHTKMLA